MIKSFGLLILRISIGTMLIHHGYEKTADIQNFADAFVGRLDYHFQYSLHTSQPTLRYMVVGC